MSRHTKPNTAARVTDNTDSALASALQQAEVLVSHLKASATEGPDVEFLLTHALVMLEFARVVVDDRRLDKS